MEQYLIDEYNVYEDKEWLAEEEIIEDYFKDEGRDFFDCGQGYCENKVNIICKIGDKFYNVHIEADINSSKQEYGDRLYWVEGITSVKYEEIEKPKPKKKTKIVYELSLTKEQEFLLEKYMDDFHIERRLCDKKLD